MPGIMSDRWIRKMAAECQMIWPFEPNAVKTVPTDHGTGATRGVVSFGVSSYGYDMRVGEEFKVFQPNVRVNKLTDYQKGYLAALIDGEGCIHKHNGTRPTHHTYALTIGNTNRELLEHTQKMVGTGTIYDGPEKENPNHSKCFYYKITRLADVQALLAQLEHHLIVKREMLNAVLSSESRASIVVDPRHIDEDSFVDAVPIAGEEGSGSYVVIPPNSFALANSVEEFQIPDDTLGIVLGKSTYARCGIICNVTPLEPGWRGFVTIEISNTTPLPARIWCNEGICQVLFFQAEERCEVSYADKKGKYQNQERRPYLPRV